MSSSSCAEDELSGDVGWDVVELHARQPGCDGWFFFFNDTATTEIYTLSLHDALPILRQRGQHHHVDDHVHERRDGAVVDGGDGDDGQQGVSVGHHVVQIGRDHV